MADDAEQPVEALAEQVKKSILPPAMLLQSAGSGLAKSYAEAAECSARIVRESVDELGRCTEEMLAARNPFGMATCYGTFLMRLGRRNTERAAEIGRIMMRAGTSVMTAQVDGSRPPVADGASDHHAESLHPPPAASG